MTKDIQSIIKGIDPKKLKIDSAGRIIVDDQDVKDKLTKLTVPDLAADTTINGYKCACTAD